MHKPVVKQLRTVQSYKFSIRKITWSAFVGVRWLRFLVMTSPSFEKSLSLGTDVAGIASRRLAISATSGYDLWFSAHHRSGHWSWWIVGSATKRSNLCWIDSRERPGAAVTEILRSSFDQIDITDDDAVGCGEGDGESASATTVSSMAPNGTN